ncbi:DinB family protein [Bacillus sp. B190/17]|uniref:DinB family protein n=1 Tax=Bacillus lumedeiriae TaxID=3058829 RepID=A0ABW8I3M3_9BACI
MAIWERFDFVRTATVNALANIDESKWDQQPEGFSNTIKWNAGHIYVSLETLLKAAAPDLQTDAEKYAPFFGMGTKPSDWPETVPSKEEVIELLTQQKARIQAHFEGRLSDQPAATIKIGPLALETIDDLLNFALFHEGLHLGIIQSQAKIV